MVDLVVRVESDEDMWIACKACDTEDIQKACDVVARHYHGLGETVIAIFHVPGNRSIPQLYNFLKSSVDGMHLAWMDGTLIGTIYTPSELHELSLNSCEHMRVQVARFATATPENKPDKEKLHGRLID